MVDIYVEVWNEIEFSTRLQKLTRTKISTGRDDRVI